LYVSEEGETIIPQNHTRANVNGGSLRTVDVQKHHKKRFREWTVLWTSTREHGNWGMKKNPSFAHQEEKEKREPSPLETLQQKNKLPWLGICHRNEKRTRFVSIRKRVG